MGRNKGKGRKGMNGCVVRINEDRLKLKYHFVEKTRFEERVSFLERRPFRDFLFVNYN